MKKTFTCLAIATALFAASCTKESKTEDLMTTCPMPTLPHTYMGQWKLVGTWYSTGTPGEWHTVDNGFELNVKADSTYTVSTPDDKVIGSNGHITFTNDSTWLTAFSHGALSVVPRPNVSLHPDNDTFYMRSYLAIEGAALKFARIRTATSGTVK